MITATGEKVDINTEKIGEVDKEVGKITSKF